MIATLKSEFRKVFTTRSTYIMIILAAAIALLLNFFFEGYKGNTGSPAALLAPTALHEVIKNTAGVVALFVSLITALSMGHEYRHNTIVYTLTANARRTQVLLAKTIVTLVAGIGIGLVLVAFGLACYFVGLDLRNAVLPTQELEVAEQLGKLLLYFSWYALIGLLLTVLIRNIIGTIAFLLVFPATVEPLLGLLLKKNAGYLPFASIDNIMGGSLVQHNVSPAKSMVIVVIYLAVIWVVTWVTFLRRDAN
jgi:ABC-type transport system involved in multi-copper enzyme maturation permease subunit